MGLSLVLASLELRAGNSYYENGLRARKLFRCKIGFEVKRFRSVQIVSVCGSAVCLLVECTIKDAFVVT